MKKSTIIIIVCLGSLIWGQHTLSLLPFEGTDVSPALLKAGYNKLETSLIESDRFKIIEKEKRDQILNEQKEQWSGCFEDSCIVEIGKLLGANYLITGNLIGLDDLFQVNIKIIDIEKGVVIEKVTRESVGDQLSLLATVETASYHIIHRMDSTYVIPEVSKILPAISSQRDTIQTVVEKPVYIDRVLEKDNYRYHRNAIGISASWGLPGQWNWGLRVNHYPLMIEVSQGLFGSNNYHSYAWGEIDLLAEKTFLGDESYGSETFISGREISIGYGWWQFNSSGATINLMVGQTEFIGLDEYDELYGEEENVWNYLGGNIKFYKNLYYVALGYVVSDGILFEEQQFYMQLGFHFTLGFGYVD